MNIFEDGHKKYNHMKITVNWRELSIEIGFFFKSLTHSFFLSFVIGLGVRDENRNILLVDSIKAQLWCLQKCISPFPALFFVTDDTGGVIVLTIVPIHQCIIGMGVLSKKMSFVCCFQ
jgi:hypothetical protein